MSGLLTELNHHSYSPAGKLLYMYGDPACTFRIHLQKHNSKAQLTMEQQIFYYSFMSAVRAAVE